MYLLVGVFVCMRACSPMLSLVTHMGVPEFRKGDHFTEGAVTSKFKLPNSSATHALSC